MALEIGTGAALLGSGVFQGLSSLVGGEKGASAAKDSAKVQAQAANNATLLQARIFQQLQGNYSPFLSRGTDAFGTLANLTGASSGDPSAPGLLTSPISTSFSPEGIPPFMNPSLPAAPNIQPFETKGGLSPTFAPTLDELEKFPGYQFALDQGLKQVQGSFAAKGLGSSEAARRGAIGYAEGLAGTTEQQAYQQWLEQIKQQLGQYTASGQLGIEGTQTGLGIAQAGFGDYFQQLQQQLTKFLGTSNLSLAQKNQIYNQIAGVAQGGLSAAGGTSTAGIQTGNTAASNITGAGAATASGIVGSTNALNAGFGGAAGSVGNTALLLALSNAGLFGSKGAGSGTGGLYG